MVGGNSIKPIVFVFGAKKGDADGRKRNLSAINTQVAYRAHERRREKKSRQRAQAKEEQKSEQAIPSLAPTSQTAFTTNELNSGDVNIRKSCPTKVEDCSKNQIFSVPPTTSEQPLQFPINQPLQQVFSLNPDVKPRPAGGRRISQESSDTNSDFDSIGGNEIWSASPSSGRYSSPATDLTPPTPASYVQINSYFDKALDPFFALPVPATDREKWLVHFCKYSSTISDVY